MAKTTTAARRLFDQEAQAFAGAENINFAPGSYTVLYFSAEPALLWTDVIRVGEDGWVAAVMGGGAREPLRPQGAYSVVGKPPAPPFRGKPLLDVVQFRVHPTRMYGVENVAVFAVEGQAPMRLFAAASAIEPDWVAPWKQACIEAAVAEDAERKRRFGVPDV